LLPPKRKNAVKGVEKAALFCLLDLLDSILMPPSRSTFCYLIRAQHKNAVKGVEKAYYCPA
jgi:hypothetical protein